MMAAFFQSIWWLLVLIGVMILIHELGHFWAARYFDVRVDAFSFGFGPRLFGYRRGETDFRFSLIPFGGYVKMAGEQPGDEASSDPRSFLAKARWKRLIIAFAGPFMNIVLALAVVTGMFMVRFPRVPDTPDPVIGYVLPDSAAAKAGVQPGDQVVQIDDKNHPTWYDVQFREVSSANRVMTVWVRRNGERMRLEVTPIYDQRRAVGFAGWDRQVEVEIKSVMPGYAAEAAGLRSGDILLSVNGEPLRSIAGLSDAVGNSKGEPVTVTYRRDGKVETTVVKPRYAADEKRWMIGVRQEERTEYVALAFPDALRESVKENTRYATIIFQMLKGIAERRMSPRSLSGPVEMARASREAANEGPMAFLGLMAMVSLNLAVFNLLPIPILDGGVILMLLVEMLMRRDLSMQVKEAVLKLGFVFLMAVVAFVLYSDITKILPPG
ncbi:MAG TPA: RIP metalloprotease RseP [Bryobacteraceae bacterium]|nr:RIP metalloprotease RseP [Bryobacteraceae bacterium]